jgi:hypothetical protein
MWQFRTSLWIFDIGFRRMNAERPPGWASQMMVFSSLALTMMAAVEFGASTVWPLALIGAVDLVATQHFVRGASHRIWMLGMLGPTRARWWIEAAALSWTLCMSCGVFGITQGNLGGPQLAWQGAFLAVARDCVEGLFVAFIASTVVGFLLGVVQGKRIRGRSLELVCWFFWSIVVIGACLVAVPEHQVLTQWIAPMLALVSVVVLCMAWILAIRRRANDPTCGR